MAPPTLDKTRKDKCQARICQVLREYFRRPPSHHQCHLEGCYRYHQHEEPKHLDQHLLISCRLSSYHLHSQLHCTFSGVISFSRSQVFLKVWGQFQASRWEFLMHKICFRKPDKVCANWSRNYSKILKTISLEIIDKCR